MDQNLREAVRRRAGSSCEYCQMPQSLSEHRHQLDHIIAMQHRGPTTLENLALACFPCNIFKGPNIAGIDPDTNVLTRLFNPRIDRWTEHFRWQGALLLGISPIGRTTVYVLDINMAVRLGERQSLIEEGVFPPR